jgi:hypothetical protein
VRLLENQHEVSEMLRDDMDYNDRFKMTVKEFGRLIVIELNRGVAELSRDRKTVTITYNDSQTRKAKTKVG